MSTGWQAFGCERPSRLVTQIAMVVTLVSLAGCGSHPARTAGSPPTPGIVPWVDRTAPPPPPPPSPQPPPAQYKGCAAAAIRSRTDGEGAAAGNVSTRITFTNVGRAPCTFDGYPTTLIGIHADGRTRVLHPFHRTMFDQAFAWTANLRTGESAGMSIASADGCSAMNRRRPTRRVRRDDFLGETIGLPGGGDVTARGHFNSACGVGVSRIGLPSRPVPNPHAYPGLTLSVDSPASADAGTSMMFTVTLSNRSNHGVALAPCPVYQEGIFAGRHAHETTYQLNCDTLHTIAAGQRVTYAMQIAVPTAAGQAKFGWSIPQASLFYGGLLTIHGRSG